MSKLTPIKAIRKKCLDCCCGSRIDVRECEAVDCSLWEYRLGKRPIDPVGSDVEPELADEDW